MGVVYLTNTRTNTSDFILKKAILKIKKFCVLHLFVKYIKGFSTKNIWRSVSFLQTLSKKFSFFAVFQTPLKESSRVGLDNCFQLWLSFLHSFVDFNVSRCCLPSAVSSGGDDNKPLKTMTGEEEGRKGKGKRVAITFSHVCGVWAN